METTNQSDKSDEKTLEEFDTILFATASQKTEHASCLIDFLEGKSVDIQVKLLQYLLENYGIPGRGNGIVLSGRKVHDDRYKSLASTLDGMIHGTVRLIIHSRKDTGAAAKMLRDMVFSFDDIEQRDYCLAEIMHDDFIPYHPIPQPHLSSLAAKRLEGIVNSNIDAVSQIRAIQRAGMDTTTAAELILRVLDTVEDFEERVGVFEVCIIRSHMAASLKLMQAGLGS